MFDELSYEGLTFDDGRGKYPERLKAVAPLGTRARIKRAAEKEGGLSTGEVIRRALAAYFESIGVTGGSHEARA